MEPWVYLLFGAGLAGVAVYLANRFLTFRAQRSTDYGEHTGEPFDMKRHLSGALTCNGVIYGPTGRVVSRFSGDFDVTWRGDEAVMREHFTYDSGEEQSREWLLSLSPDGQIDAKADDVPGGGRGRQLGPAVQMRYRLRLPEDTGGHVLSATDWMYLTPGGIIMNRSQFRKFGIKVCELVATIRRKDSA